MESQLLESWTRFADRYPDNAAEVKSSIRRLYSARSDQALFDAELNCLQGLISTQAQNILGVNMADKQALATWAQAMGMIFLVKKERSL